MKPSVSFQGSQRLDLREGKASAGISNAEWLPRAFPYYELIRILNFYLDLDCWLIPVDNLDHWYAVRIHRRSAWPMDFDHVFGKREARADFNRSRFEKVIRDKRTLWDTRNGLSDFFVPVLRRGEVVGILEFGDFLKKPPTPETLRAMWKELTGFEPSSTNQDFLNYARIILETPVLEGAAFRALQEILELHAQLLGGEGNPEFTARRTDELKEKILAREFPHNIWLEKVVKNNWVYPPTWFLGKISKFERAELGMDRLPTTVIAVSKAESAWDRDELKRLLGNHFFQREIFKFSKTLSHSTAVPLGDYGMLVFTSPNPDREEAEAKKEILDKIESISRFADAKLRVKIIAGVGRCPRPGENISKAYREAVTALGFCRSQESPILFYDEVRADPALSGASNFIHGAKRLIDAYANGALGETEMARNQYVEIILSQSAGRPEMVRLHILYALGQIVDILGKRSSIQSESHTLLFETLERQLQERDNAADLISVFREFLGRLLEMTLRPAEGTQALRLESAKTYIHENYKLDLKLGEVARKNGFSMSVFGRGFKKEAGMGFSAYLRKTRLDQAKKLLVSTHLSIAQVSRESGFKNLQYFFDVFKRSVGRTPQEFREFSRMKPYPKD